MSRTPFAKLTLAVAATLVTGSAFADEAKHFRHGNHYAPVRPAIVHTPVVQHAPFARHAPVVVNRHVPVYSHNHYNHNRGYWRNGRWIAPVVVGAAVLGTIAAANSYAYVPPAVTYVNPAPTYIAPVVHHRNNYDGFAAADRDHNGVIDKWEAGYDREVDRWFYDIDVNRDGVLSREELRAWSAGRASTGSSSGLLN